MHIPDQRAHPGFCRTRGEFGRLCESPKCVPNVICIKIIKILYSLIVRLRTNGIEIVLENLMPTEILIRFWQDFTILNGFGGVRTIKGQFPTGKI